MFREHAGKLVEVANLACSMSSNEEGVKMVRLAARQIDTLCPQVKLFVAVLSMFSSICDGEYLISIRSSTQR